MNTRTIVIIIGVTQHSHHQLQQRMGDPFAGNWKHYSSENLDEFMKVMGAPWIARKMASATSPTVEAIVDGDHYKFTMSSPGWSMATEFDIGREFMLSLPDGSKKKVSVNTSKQFSCLVNA